jgi:hypothetical protein
LQPNLKDRSAWNNLVRKTKPHGGLYSQIKKEEEEKKKKQKKKRRKGWTVIFSVFNKCIRFSEILRRQKGAIPRYWCIVRRAVNAVWQSILVQTVVGWCSSVLRRSVVVVTSFRCTLLHLYLRRQRESCLMKNQQRLPPSADNMLHSSCSWGAFAKLRKMTKLFQICASARVEQLDPKWTNFHEIWYLKVFRKSLEKIRLPIRTDKNNGCFAWRPMQLCDRISLSSF